MGEGYGYFYNANVELGDGYNDKLNRFIKFNGEPKGIVTEYYRHNMFKIISELNSACLISYPLGLYLEESSLKFLDFYILNDYEDYYTCSLIVYSRRKFCNGCTYYSDNCNYFIDKIYYGIYLEVIVQRNLFPKAKDKMMNLLNTALDDINILTKEQKQIKCKVLINGNETKEMKLKEVFKFKDKFLLGEYGEYHKVVYGYRPHRKASSIEIKNEEYFKKFLAYLYTCYRKVELKLEKEGYPMIKEIIKNENLPIKNIIFNLEKAKDDYKNMDENDFYKMYPIMKELFYKYQDYLRYFIDNRLTIDEGDELPGTIEELQQWVYQLNEWKPINIDNKWYGVDRNYLIIMPKNCKQFKDFFCSFDKYKKLQIQVDAVLNEPIFYSDDEKISGLFGFIKPKILKNRINITEESTYILNIPCPLECSGNIRIWFCCNCGEICRVYHAYTFCNCGESFINPNNFICNNPIHQKMDLTSVNQWKNYEYRKSQTKESVVPPPPIAGPPPPYGAYMMGRSVGNEQIQVIIPNELGGTIIGRRGKRIKKLRKQSGANIEITPPQGNDDRVITIIGSQPQIQAAQIMLQQSIRNSKEGKRYMQMEQPS